MGSASQQATDTATAGVIARPPLLFLACLLLVGFVLDHLLPLPLVVPEAGPVRWIVRRRPDPRSASRS